MGEKDKKEIKKQEKILKDNNEKTIVIGEVVENFIKEEPRELSQEEEIENFKLKKIKEQYDSLTEEEREKKAEAERKEEEELEKQKRELLISLTQRIPAIEKRIYGQAQNKKENLKVKTSAEKSVTKEEKAKEQADENNIEQSKGFERE